MVPLSGHDIINKYITPRVIMGGMGVEKDRERAIQVMREACEMSNGTGYLVVSGESTHLLPPSSERMGILGAG